jgi:hypothetical protein
MPSSGTSRRVALVKTDVWEELIASIIRVTKIGELGTTLAVTGNRRLLLLVVGFVGLVATSNSYALSILQASQITMGRTRRSRFVVVMTSRCLVAAPNAERSHSSFSRAVRVLSYQLPTAADLNQ